MPVVKLPNGTSLSFPDGMSEDDMSSAIYANFPEYAKPQVERTKTEAVSDGFSSFGASVNNTLKTVTDLAGTDNPVSNFLGDNAKTWQGNYSPAYREELQKQEAEKAALGADASYLDRAALAAKQVVRNPIEGIGELAGNIAPMAVGGVAGLGVKGMAALSAAMGAGAVKGGIAETIQNAPETNLMADPLYAQMRKDGVSELEAKAKLGEQRASYGEAYGKILLGGGIGAVVGKFGSVENALANIGKAGAKDGILKSIGKEVATEIPQEMAENYLGNKGAAAQGADIAPDQNVIEAGVKAGILAAAGGGVAGLGHGNTPTSKPASTATPDAAPAEALRLGNTPDPYISFPDGTVARKSEIDAYVSSLPEDQQIAARAKLAGLAPQPTKPDDILKTESVDDAISVFNESLKNIGSDWQAIGIEPTGESSNIAAYQAGQNWQAMAPEQSGSLEQQRMDLEREGAARSAERDATIAALGKQYQALGIAQPTDDLQAQRAGMRPTPESANVGTAPEIQPNPAAGVPAISPDGAGSMELGNVDGGRGPGIDGRTNGPAGVGQSGELPRALPTPTVDARLVPLSKRNVQNTQTPTGVETQAAPVETRTDGASQPTATQELSRTGSSSVQPEGLKPPQNMGATSTLTTQVEPSGKASNATTPPAIGGIFKLSNGTYARFQDGIWYRGEDTPQKALKTEFASGTMKAESRTEDQSWEPHAGFTLDAYGSTKSLKPFSKTEKLNLTQAETPVQPVSSAGAAIESVASDAPVSANAPEQEVQIGPVGRNNVPLSEGGKPYKTKLGADTARRGQTMMRTKRVEGGFALVEKSPAQLAAEARAAKRISQPKTSPIGEPIPAHSMIASAGGLSKAIQSDMGIGDNPMIGNRKLFAGTGRGLTIEQATEKLIEDGYLQEGATHSQAMDLIKRSITNPQYTPEGTERMAQKEQQEREAAFNAEQEALALAQEADDTAYDAIVAAFEAAVLELPQAETQSDMSMEDALLAAGFTEQELSNDTAEQTDVGGTDTSAESASIEGNQSPAEAEAGNSPQAAEGRDSAARQDQGDGEGLTAPTREDVLAQQDRAEAATKADAKAATDAANKAKADAERDEFTLTGSDRAADVGAAGGQADIFGMESEQSPATQATAILDAAEVTGKERLDVLKDVKAGTLTAEEVQAAYPSKTPDQGKRFANESTASYNGGYESDLFGEPLPTPTGKDRDAKPQRTGVHGDAQPRPGLRDTQAPAGEYHVNTIVGTVTQRELGASRILTAQQAAQATQYLYQSAVERMDGIVTDKNGKPLAVVGGFKGATSQTAVYPATLMAEAIRIPGAANIWFSHNHPSGNATLSRADESLNRTLSDVFRGSGIEPRGLLAVSDGVFSHVGVDGSISASNQDIGQSTGSAKVPVVERSLAASKGALEAITDPQQAKALAKRLYDKANAPGIVLLDAQNKLAAWIPISPEMTGALRNTGGLKSIYRAVSQSNAGAAIIAHGGELDVRGRLPASVSPSENIAAALSKIDVRPLDSINVKTWQSAAESGLGVESGPMFSQSAVMPAFKPATIESLKAAIKEFTGLDGLSKLGRIVATTSDDIKATWEPLIGKAVNLESEGEAGKVQAFYDPKSNTVFMVADNIRAGTESAVLAHELMHKWGKKALGDAGWDRLLDTINTWKNADPESAEHAVYSYARRKVEAIGLDLESQEMLPYAVEAALKMGITPSLSAKRGTVANWLESVRQSLKMAWTKITGNPELFKSQDLVNLAFGIAQMENPEHSAEIGAAMRKNLLESRADLADERTGISAALLELGRNDDLYQYPSSDSIELEHIAEDKNNFIRVSDVDKNTDDNKLWMLANTTPADDPAKGIKSWILKLPNGKMATMTRNGGEVHINVSGIGENNRGSAIYDLAANYALNNGLKFIGDPLGVSASAMRRRLENMLSSAIKYGTTDHLAPHADQLLGDADIGVPPLDWTNGDTLGNIRSMVDVSMAATEFLNPIETKHVEFDPTSLQYRDPQGNRLDVAAVRTLLGDRGRAPGVGQGGDTTLRRYALFKSLLQSVGNRSEILGNIHSGWGSAGPGLGGSLEKTFYSRSGIVGKTNRQHTPEQLRAMKNVGFEVETPTLKERAQALWKDAGKKLAQGIADQFAPIKDIDQEAYGLMRLAKGASGAFESLLQGGKLKLTDGVYDFDDANKGGVVDKLLIPLQGEHHDFMRWVAANRAERLQGEGKENLFSSQDIADLKTLASGTTDFDYTIQTGPGKGKVTRDRTLIYADSNRVFNEFNKNVLDMAEQSGLIDGASRKVWEHEFYVPFYRVADDADGGVRGMSVKGSVVRQQAFKELKGGKNALNADLLDNTLMNWAHLLDASAKNRAAKATIEAAERMGIATGGNQSTLAQMGTSINNKNGVVWYMDGGQKRYSLIDNKGDGAFLMTAITALEYSGMRNPVMNAMGAMKHVLTVGVTASPFFKVRNLIRDSVQVIATGQIHYNPAKNLAQGWKLTNPKSDAYFRLLAGGGTIHFGTMMEGSEAKRVQSLVESGVDKSTILDSDKKMKAFYRQFIKPGITAYNELGNRGEAVNRAALYDQLLKQGKTHAEASLQARDLMDFSMQGSFTTIRFLAQVVPFFNARIQGMYKLGRAAKEDPARFSAVLGATALFSLALLGAYGDDDDWKKREDWDRNNYWWFKFGGQAFRIPKPFEVGAIATLAERGFELAFDKEMTNKRFRSQVLTLLSDNLSMNPVPQLVKPILDVYANKDSFSGRPIETLGMDKLKPEYRFTDRTSMTARAASTEMNAVTGLVGVDSLSPVQIDSMLRGYFGWLGSFIVGAGDKLARPATDQPGQTSPDYWKVATGGMVSQLEDAPSRYVSAMYEQAKTLEEAYGTYRMLVKEGKFEEARDFMTEHRDELGRYKQVESVKRAEAKFNERIRMIERSAMDGDAKREAIRKIREQKDRIARQLAPA